MRRALRRRYGHMGIEVARKARADQSLDKLIRHDGQTMTKRAFMDRLRAQGGQIIVRRERSEVAEEKLRRKIEQQARGWLPIGNPNHPEMRAHNALKAKLADGVFKEKTYVMLPSGSHFEVSKAEADYFAAKAP